MLLLVTFNVMNVVDGYLFEGNLLVTPNSFNDNYLVYFNKSYDFFV
jgi:hypothetical protein